MEPAIYLCMDWEAWWGGRWTIKTVWGPDESRPAGVIGWSGPPRGALSLLSLCPPLSLPLPSQGPWVSPGSPGSKTVGAESLQGPYRHQTRSTLGWGGQSAEFRWSSLDGRTDRQMDRLRDEIDGCHLQISQLLYAACVLLVSLYKKKRSQSGETLEFVSRKVLACAVCEFIWNPCAGVSMVSLYTYEYPVDSSLSGCLRVRGRKNRGVRSEECVEDVGVDAVGVSIPPPPPPHLPILPYPSNTILFSPPSISHTLPPFLSSTDAHNHTTFYKK